MASQDDSFGTPEARLVVRHLANLVREARLARRMPQTELAARARVTQATVHRVEHASGQSSLNTWLSLMEQLGLLTAILELRDPVSEALRLAQRKQRARRTGSSDDLDF